MNKPKVLFYNFGARPGGAEIVLLEYLKQPSGQIEASVLLNEQGPFLDMLEMHNIPVKIIETKADQFYAMKREQAPGLSMLRAIPSALGLFFRVVKYLKTNDFDLIVSNTFKSHLILGFAAKFYGFKSVWRFHDIVQREYEFNQFSRLNIALMKFVIPNIQKVLPVSKAVTTSFANHGFDTGKFSVVHNGIDIGREPTTPKSDTDQVLVIGWIGQFAAWKGVKEFINLAKSLVDAQDQIGKDLKFVIAGSALFGDQAYEAEVKDMVTESYAGHFEFLGQVSDIDAFYDRIDVFFHTSVAPDPFPTTILEAGCRGKLVFASDLGGAGEIVQNGETGYLINMFDDQDTLEKVMTTLKDFGAEQEKGLKLQTHIGRNLGTSLYRTRLEAELLQLL